MVIGLTLGEHGVSRLRREQCTAALRRCCLCDGSRQSVVTAESSGAGCSKNRTLLSDTFQESLELYGEVC